MLTIKRNYKSISEIFEKYMSTTEYEDIDFIFDLVYYHRAKYTKKTPVVRIEELLSEIRNDKNKGDFLKQKLYATFSNKKKINLLTDAGLLSSVSFFKELRRRLSHQLIPDQPSHDSIQYVLNQIFYKSSDSVWLQSVPMENWHTLFDILSLPTFYEDSKDKATSKEILLSMMILSQRMGGFALQTDVMRMVPEYSSLESPFIAIDDELNAIHRNMEMANKAYLDMEEHKLDYKQLNILSEQCENFVEQAVNNTSKYGISFSVNQTLLLIRQQIRRIRKLYNFLFISNEEEKKTKTIQFYLSLVKTNAKKNNIRKLIDDSVYNITYEITNYTGKTGEHYITSGSREYFSMFKTAFWGGVIVGFMCLAKLFLSKLDTSEFIYALNYSLNYAIGFVVIYLAGATLATKQPAMTASTIAKTLENLNTNDKKKKEKQYSEFSELFTRLFRSQFIAFAGNVLAAFPVSLLLIWGLFYLTGGYNLAESKSHKLLAELDIRQTPVFLHSCIAGIFLFLSGIIAGNVASVNNFNNFYYRLSEHPVLKSVLGKERMVRISGWMQKKWPGIISNIWFGFFMGCTGVIGTFLGLDLDIRHITFASGSLALGLFGVGFNVTLNILIWTILGIFIIGFGNFIVSFSLSLFIALRSREVPFFELKNLAKSVWVRFKQNPMAFFIPIGNGETENQK
ncbi:recombinase [Capnocytophaga felis]|uniref:Recombinase n=1 Tax=Capnocytophaga felis TaxID=2267611 RepID=A0A5M4B561_9FLAO|nr:recombinase [Capnocytophaga felis]GET44734.1 recombinase [Capnocytophaga felis]GET49702.1 recombinase [Capnocytophaga felis]